MQTDYCPVYTRYFCLLLACLWLMTGCQKVFRQEKEFYAYANDASHGLLKTRQVADVTFTLKYLPAGLLYLKQRKDADAPPKDSLQKELSQQQHFVLTIQPTDDKNDIMYRDLANYQEYKERAVEMNFRMDSYLAMQIGGTDVPPLLCTLENTYSVRNGRSLYMVFPAPPEGKPVDIVFTDEIFNTGIHHFVFDSKDIATANQIPVAE